MQGDFVPIHGNYKGYYLKRPFTQDPRLSLLPSDLLKGARVLDVGCNEGFVTCEIGQIWGAEKAIGVDIDSSLIQAAWKRRRTLWCQQGPASADTLAEPTTKKRQTSETTGKERACVPHHFPASCEHMFGTADWVRMEITEDKIGYDVVIAFSLSKWIHLNDGDEGLIKFFQRVHSVLKPGGVFILEPQEWDTYSKAKRMSAKLRDNAKSLKIKPQDFPAILKEVGFGPVRHLGTTGEGGFHRSVDLYERGS